MFTEQKCVTIKKNVSIFSDMCNKSGAVVMEIFFKVLLIIFSIGLISIVLLQKGKSAGLSGVMSGAEHLFGKQKARGIELVLQRTTVVLAVGFFILALVVAYFVKK